MKESQYRFIAESGDEGKRIDKYLSDKIESLSRSYIAKLIAQGKVTVNSGTVDKNYTLKAKDIIVVSGTKTDYRKKIIPQPIELDIKYEDSYMAIVSKPAGMVTHPAPGKTTETLVNALIYHFNSLSSCDQGERPGIVHRLDKDTSGLLVVAKDNKTHRLMAEKFKGREVKKTYVALIYGKLPAEEGEIKLPVGRSRVDRKKMSISIDRGKKAQTSFKVIEEYRKNCSLVKIKLKTGRTHQIRVHFSYIDHPVIGDSKYGNKESGKIANEIGLERQFLHAKKLKFMHPVTGKMVEIEDNLASDLQECLAVLRK